VLAVTVEDSSASIESISSRASSAAGASPRKRLAMPEGAAAAAIIGAAGGGIAPANSIGAVTVRSSSAISGRSGVCGSYSR
jgi:hypothetical protein